MELVTSQPKAALLYYNDCGNIRQHNQNHQDLQLERVLQTQEWCTRVNISILKMIFVDTSQVYSSLTSPLDVDDRGKLHSINVFQHEGHAQQLSLVGNSA